jgi:valyl-tRNA synthetase
MEDVRESRFFSFPDEEEKILKYWNSIDAFHEQLRRTEGKPEYVFFDGPPFATGMPHYGHLLAGTIKVCVCIEYIGRLRVNGGFWGGGMAENRVALCEEANDVAGLV